MSDIFDGNGNIQISIEAVVDRLSNKIAQQSVEIATLQSANALLQEELLKRPPAPAPVDNAVKK